MIDIHTLIGLVTYDNRTGFILFNEQILDEVQSMLPLIIHGFYAGCSPIRNVVHCPR